MTDLPAKIIRFGEKAIYLPKFTVALIRTPKLSPYHAKFLVPLNFSKFDLRDYLFHAYGVRALSIRSFVQQQAVRDRPEGKRQFFRPDAKKYMTIEMDQPFVWPKGPETWEPWGKEMKEVSKKSRLESIVETPEKQSREASKLREQAKAVLEGERRGLRGWEGRRTSKYIEAKEPEYKVRI